VPVFPITRADLPRLEGLLRASYGDGLDMQDELDYFPDPAPPDWLFLTDANGEPQGFLRYFAVSDSLFAAEFFVPPSANRSQYLEMLLEAFSKCRTLPKDSVLRVDALASDLEMETSLKKFARINEVRHFHHFERQVRGLDQPLERVALNGVQLEQTRDVLAALKTYELEQLEELWNTKQLFILEIDGRVVAVTHLQHKSDTVLDIATFATTEAKRGQGYGTRLLTTILETLEPAVDTVELKVRSSNEAAIRLYERCGFTHVPSRDESWWYTAWDEPLNP
jgi:ribosomal protein S18 acetylase RimI-like enzyme